MVLFRVFQDFKLAYQNTPLVRPRLQVSPLKLAGRARIELVVQWPRIVIADDLNRLARQQLVKAAKNGGVALGWRNLAHVDHERLDRKSVV